MEKAQHNGTKLERIEATVMPQTAESIRRSQEDTGLTIGELIDRMTLHIKPRDAQVAIQLILEDVAIIISELSAEQTREVLSAVTSTLTALLPLDEMKLSFHDAIEKQQALLHGLMNMNEADREELWRLISK